jgi:ribose transport system ATP-binding protein
MEEVLSLSDRALVMHEGRISGELSRDRLDEESVMHLATGSDPLGTPPQAGHYL